MSYTKSDDAISRLTPEQRRAIMAELPARASTLTKRRGGRKARLAGND